MDLLNSDNARMNQDIIRKAGEIVEKHRNGYILYWLK